MRHLSRTAVALAVGSVISMSAQAEIIISEYVEGSSNNKAIELYNNAETGSIDLAGYTLANYKDGSDTPYYKNVSLTGTLGAGEVMLVVNKKFKKELLPEGVTTVKNSNINFNGGDAVGLFLNDVLVDVVGDIPAKGGWGEDVTLKRYSNSLSPSTSFDINEWKIEAKDNVDGLGSVDGVEPPLAFVCETESGEVPEFTSINEIQGSGDTSPFIKGDPFITSEDFFVRGVVTARGDGLFKGFYLEALDADDDDSTSDGLFIHTGYAPTDDIKPGAVVCVKGKVQELFNRTQLASDYYSYKTTSTEPVPALHPLIINEGETLRDALERYEGMKVELDAGTDLRVTRNFSRDYDAYRNNMVVSHKAPLIKPTQLYAAESDKANAERDNNKANQLFIESEYKAKDGELPYFADFNAEDGYIRIGDRVENLEGVIDYSHKNYRLVATNQLGKADFVRDDEVAHERTDAPVLAESGIKVASFNVLNFFTSFSEIGGPLNASCKNQADADNQYRGCNRGSRNTAEFPLQRAKIVNAMKAMDADIIGIMEMENNGFGDGSAIKNLVDTLNAEFSDPADFYTYVEISAEDAKKYAKDGADFEGIKYFGSDAIMVAMFYRPASVSLAGDAQVIATPEQHGKVGKKSLKKYQRHSLVQGFNVPGQKEPLHVIVNHFKSKGSGCIEDVKAADDLQGNCTEFRVSAAEVVGQAVSKLKGDVLVLGDLNSYGMEDPVLALTTIPEARKGKVKTASSTTLNGEEYDVVGRVLEKGAGLVNLNDPTAFSYNYGAELGSLDHVLGNVSVVNKRLGITDWHINSLESNLFEYGGKYTGDLDKSENAFSASDHDPVIVVLDYKGIADGVKVKPVRDGESATLPVAISRSDAGKYLEVTLNVTPTAKLKSFSGDVSGSEQTESVQVTHLVTQVEADSGSAIIALPAELAVGGYQAKLALYEQDPRSISDQKSDDLGSATISVEKAVSSSTPTPTPTPTTKSIEENSSGGSFGFGALLALAGFGWTRRRRS
ncbi:ExeM/NucH family extracellular endonuclease [uncultured Photobacterium sp.]|uniref:ExeM/NucH family extracellular endonuclease n=1 Tax=uncultured Photobacterium sp. TaxID=173973 RepID=UPI002616C318|nr:ExeM/NucH family extracellular endonuclease [uncultured Photobacterium sp.]